MPAHSRQRRSNGFSLSSTVVLRCSFAFDLGASPEGALCCCVVLVLSFVCCLAFNRCKIGGRKGESKFEELTCIGIGNN